MKNYIFTAKQQNFDQHFSDSLKITCQKQSQPKIVCGSLAENMINALIVFSNKSD